MRMFHFSNGPTGVTDEITLHGFFKEVREKVVEEFERTGSQCHDVILLHPSGEGLKVCFAEIMNDAGRELQHVMADPADVRSKANGLTQNLIANIAKSSGAHGYVEMGEGWFLEGTLESSQESFEYTLRKFGGDISQVPGSIRGLFVNARYEYTELAIIWKVQKQGKAMWLEEWMKPKLDGKSPIDKAIEEVLRAPWHE